MVENIVQRIGIKTQKVKEYASNAIRKQLSKEESDF
jgi:hypothetical protein